MDEVDRILAAWRAEAPELDTEPLEILSRVTRLARHLDLARRTSFAAHGLEVWEFDVLAALRREGPPYELSPGELIRHTLSTSGAMTNRIDRLQSRGLVTRERNPLDRRGVRVRLTPAGRELVGRALADLLAFEREILRRVDTEARRGTARTLRSLLAPFEAG